MCCLYHLLYKTLRERERERERENCDYISGIKTSFHFKIYITMSTQNTIHCPQLYHDITLQCLLCQRKPGFMNSYFALLPL